jgi:hypothetical protein
MGPLWDFNEAFGECCGYPIEVCDPAPASRLTPLLLTGLAEDLTSLHDSSPCKKTGCLVAQLIFGLFILATASRLAAALLNHHSADAMSLRVCAGLQPGWQQ